jgi:hypothetical protein
MSKSLDNRGKTGYGELDKQKEVVDEEVKVPKPRGRGQRSGTTEPGPLSRSAPSELIS